jgi:DnaD/phage-associated family protein
MNNPVWQDPRLFKLWMLCLLEATHKEHEQLIGKQIIKLYPGQFVTGRYALAKSYNEGAKKANRVPEVTLWRWMKMLETYDFLNINSTTKFSVITINNWIKYQPNEQLMNNKRTTNEQQVITNNNGNNGNNEKKKDTTTTTDNPVVLFEKLLCRLSVIQSDKLYQWVDDFKGQTEIINEAIKIADNKNKRYFGFVEFLLKDWSNNKLESLERIRVYEQEKFNKLKKPAAPYNKKPVRTEQLPDWFEENPYQKNEKQNVTAEELDEILQEFRKS